MALPHIAPAELAHVGPLGHKLRDTETHALFKAEQLEVMRIVLPQGKVMPRHRVDGEITVQCLEGDVDFVVDGKTLHMESGDFVHLAGGMDHELRARADSSLLVTICLIPSAGGPA